MPSPLTLSALILGIPGVIVLINAACAAADRRRCEFANVTADDEAVAG